jgi:LPS-assembly lipoprotein
MNSMTHFKSLIIALVISMTTACGWHLRGQVDIPVPLRILDLNVSAVDFASQNAIRQSLLSNGITLSKDAQYQLRVIKESSGKRTLAVTSNAKASEYELSQSLDFQLFNMARQAVSPLLMVTSYQTLLYDANAEIGKAQEEQNLRLDMKQSNAYKMLLRLKNIKLMQPPAQPSTESAN